MFNMDLVCFVSNLYNSFIFNSAQVITIVYFGYFTRIHKTKMYRVICYRKATINLICYFIAIEKKFHQSNINEEEQ